MVAGFFFFFFLGYPVQWAHIPQEDQNDSLEFAKEVSLEFFFLSHLNQKRQFKSETTREEDGN